MSVRTAITGFSGGVFWGLISLAMYYFNFLEISPKMYVLRPWIKAEWTNRFLGDMVSLLLVGMLSIIIAFIYSLLFKKVHSIWIGLMYGIILWIILFLVVHPFFSNIPSIDQFTRETIVSSLSLFILYGTFIGYSISYDYYERNLPKK